MKKFVTIYNRGLGGLFGDAASGGFLKKLESLSLEGSLNKSDAVFWGSLTTKDAETAANAQKVVEAAQVLLRGRLQALPRMPKEVLDAIKGIKFTVEGAKVKATGQIKVDAVVKWIEDQRNPELRLRDDQAKQEQSTNQAATDQNKLGLALARRGKVNKAIVHYRKALEIDPDFVAAHNNLGLALAGRGQVEEAIVHYRKALMIRPDNADAYNNLGAAMAECGRVNKAIAYYRKALEIRPDNAEVHNNFGIALAGRGQVAEAIAHFQSALKIKPDLADAHSNLGLVLAGRGQIDEAIAHYRKALEIKPDYENAHNNLGAALASRGQLAEAIVHYRKALEIKPDNADAHNNLGDGFGLPRTVRRGHRALPQGPGNQARQRADPLQPGPRVGCPRKWRRGDCAVSEGPRFGYRPERQGPGQRDSGPHQAPRGKQGATSRAEQWRREVRFKLERP